jgi:hypothetical protein
MASSQTFDVTVSPASNAWICEVRDSPRRFRRCAFTRQDWSHQVRVRST